MIQTLLKKNLTKQLTKLLKGTLCMVVAFCVVSVESSHAANSYPFVGHAQDLPAGAVWKVNNDHYDLVVVRYDSQTKRWTALKPGANNSTPQSKDHLIDGMPIYAIAGGEVVTCWRNAPDNPADKPHRGRDGCGDSDDDGNLCEHYGQCSCTIPRPGNHLNVLTQDGRMILYAHLKAASIPEMFCPKQGEFVQNANDESGPNGHNPDTYLAPGTRPKITQGQQLGLVGYSGATSTPHLHNHLQLYPQNVKIALNYENVWVQLKQGNQDIAANGWQTLQGALSTNPDHLILPSYSRGLKEIARHGLAMANYQFTFDHITGSGYMLAWIDGFSFRGETYFNVLFRPSTGKPWAAFHNLTGTDYQSKFNEYTNAGFRLKQIESYQSGNQVRYAAIFVKESGPSTTAYHGLSASEHQKQFDTLTQSGWRPINISVVSIQGNRIYTALYQKVGVGSYVARSALSPEEYQAEFDKNKQAGRQLVYLNAYEHAGNPFFTAIWNSVTKGSFTAQHGLSGTQYQQAWENATQAGMLTQYVTAYTDKNTLRYAALWRK